MTVKVFFFFTGGELYPEVTSSSNSLPWWFDVVITASKTAWCWITADPPLSSAEIEFLRAVILTNVNCWLPHLFLYSFPTHSLTGNRRQSGLTSQTSPCSRLEAAAEKHPCDARSRGKCCRSDISPFIVITLHRFWSAMCWTFRGSYHSVVLRFIHLSTILW